MCWVVTTEAVVYGPRSCYQTQKPCSAQVLDWQMKDKTATKINCQVLTSTHTTALFQQITLKNVPTENLAIFLEDLLYVKF